MVKENYKEIREDKATPSEFWSIVNNFEFMHDNHLKQLSLFSKDYLPEQIKITSCRAHSTTKCRPPPQVRR